MAAMAVAFGFVLVSRGVADAWMVFLLPIEQAFNATRQQTAGVYSTYMLATGLSAPLAGFLLRRFGSRVCYALGATLIAAANAMASRADGLLALYVCIGILSSVGISAIGIVPASALVSRWFTRRMSLAMGAVYAGLGAGSLLLVPLVQASIDWQGWRGTYAAIGWTMAAVTIIALALPWRLLDRGTPRRPEPGTAGAEQPQGLTLRQAMRHREFAGMLVAFGCTGFSMYLVIVQVVPFLIESGLSPLRAATAVGICGMLSVPGVLLAGWLGERFGLHRIALLTFCCTGGGILCLIAMSFGMADWLLALYVGAFGIAQGARGPIIATLSNRLFPGPAAATIYGVVYAASYVGASAGALISGALHDLTDSYRPALALAIVTVMLAASPFVLLRTFRAPVPVRNKGPQSNVEIGS